MRATGRRARAPVRAVLLDMDGVVTDTAEAHAAAWKRLFDAFLAAREARPGEDHRPFDPVADYRRYVDGKPRRDGVRSFLAARGITLPEGEAGAPEKAPTVRSLAERKNGFFHEWLAANRVESFPSTVALLKKLKKEGVKRAVFTASRNGPAVLHSAGVEELFDSKVDGTDMAALGLPGKPDPAIMLEAARRLDVAPAEAAVVEDAIAGVEAGAAGDFAQVIGIDRAGQAEALKAAGADLVVGDLAELSFTPEQGFCPKTARRRQRKEGR